MLRRHQSFRRGLVSHPPKLVGVVKLNFRVKKYADVPRFMREIQAQSELSDPANESRDGEVT